MADSDIEQILKRYRPMQAPEDLSARVLAPAMFEARASWKWAVAAATLLIATIVLHGTVGTSAPVDRQPAAMSRDMSELAIALGADSVARRSAEVIVIHEYNRVVQR